ncbi:MAG: hypothetical protein INQ03_08540 [Candidatus Heimdallarchaeota archaeon]|nr:hypothetical protein [Candidatus Heimdallarchaeota archaeon]
MNKRAQIFLILTILVVTFLMSISTVLLELQKANYSEVVPDADNVLIAWDNVITGLEQIFDIEIAIRSQAGSASAADIYNDVASNFGPAIDDLETYFIGQGLSAIITPTSTVDYTNNGQDSTDLTLSIIGTFQIHLQSGNVEIDQILEMNVEYHGVSTATTLVLTKTVNDLTTYLVGATSSVGNFQDYLNGYYTFTDPGGLYQVTLENQILMRMSTV